MNTTTLLELCDCNARIYDISINNISDWYNNIYIAEKNYHHIHTDKYYVHSYMPIYDKLFETYKDCSINLLEIGVQQGGSIKLWYDYFDKGQIFGVDIDPLPEWLNKFNRIKIFNMDAYKKENLSVFDDISFNIIIDDGPHTLESMKFCAEHYIYKLVKHGLLIIEDIPEYEWIEEILREILENISYTYEIFDLRKEKNRFDDIMLVIMKN